MTVAERKSVLEAWTKAVAGRILVIAHVGGTCQADCIELARHAAGLGVNAVAPFYLKPDSVEELVAFTSPSPPHAPAAILHAYHIPSR